MNILVADDTAMLRSRLTALLSTMDGVGEIYESVDCASTLESVERLQPDLLVLDFRMPDGTGLNVLHKLADFPVRPRVLMLTTYGDPELRKRCLDAGAEAFFEKGREFMGAVSAIQSLAAEAAQ